MKAMVCEAFGGPEVLALREMPDPPPPGPGEVQVRIAARGVQYVDVLMLAGKYQFRPEPPFIPGNEGAGEVVAVGQGVAGFKLGDRIMSRHRLGAFAQLGNSRAENCNPVPAGMSLEQAAVFSGAYHTAYHALMQRGRMKAGDWVMVHGAAGGIGIVYDPIGAETFDESLRCLAWGGRILVLGFLGGGPSTPRTNYLLIKGLEVIGVRLGGVTEHHPEIGRANMKTLVELAGEGKLRPRISHRFPLERAGDAIQAVIDRKVIGKAVLVG